MKEQTNPFIIGVSGISGAGKTTLVKRMAQILQATAVFWDDFDEISKAPADHVAWYHSSRDYAEWIYNDLAATLGKLKDGQAVQCPATRRELHPTRQILFDAPLGYCHQATGKHIDFLACLDTPLDIALARRLLRDYSNHSDLKKMRAELEYYLSHARPLFILAPEEKQAHLIIDGSLPTHEQCRLLLAALQLGGSV